MRTGMWPCARANAKPWTGTRRWASVMDKLEHVKASIRAKVEHPFRVIKRQFGHVKVRDRGLAKSTVQLQTQFALSNL